MDAIVLKAYRETKSYQDFIDRIKESGLITDAKGGRILYDSYQLRFRLFGISLDRWMDLDQKERFRNLEPKFLISIH